MTITDLPFVEDVEQKGGWENKKLAKKKFVPPIPRDELENAVKKYLAGGGKIIKMKPLAVPIPE